MHGFVVSEMDATIPASWCGLMDAVLSLPRGTPCRWIRPPRRIAWTHRTFAPISALRIMSTILNAASTGDRATFPRNAYTVPTCVANRSNENGLPIGKPLISLVAGAGFEPATFGL